MLQDQEKLREHLDSKVNTLLNFTPKLTADAEKLGVGSYSIGEEVYYSLPNAFADQQSLLGVIAYICFGNKVVFVESDVLEEYALDNETSKRLKGVIFGLRDKEPRRLGSYDKKEKFEQGRTLAFAMRLKGEFIERGKIAGLDYLNLLSKNHDYFENEGLNVVVDKDAKISRPKPGRLRSLLESVLSGDKDVLRKSVDILISGIRKLRITVNIENYFEPFDEFAKRYYRTKEIEEQKPSSKKKKGKSAQEVQKTVIQIKPDKPSSNSLVPKPELEVISKLMDLDWVPYTDFQKRWKEACLELGYQSICPGVISSITARYSALQKFGAMTTKRLQQVRKYLADKSPDQQVKDKTKSLAKKEVTPETIRAFFLQQDNAVEYSLESISAVIPKSKWVAAVASNPDFFNCAKLPDTIAGAEAIIKNKLARLFTTWLAKPFNLDDSEYDFTERYRFSEAQRFVIYMIRSRRFLLHLNNVMIAISKSKRPMFPSEVTNLLGGLTKVSDYIDILSNLFETDWEGYAAIMAIYDNDPKSDLATYVHWMHERVSVLGAMLALSIKIAKEGRLSKPSDFIALENAVIPQVNELVNKCEEIRDKLVQVFPDLLAPVHKNAEG